MIENVLVGVISGKDFEQLKKEFHDVHVWIIGHDTYYGNHIAISKVYDLTKVKADHIFEIGDNLNTRSIQAV